nr:MAG: DNA pilot protein [Microviridae sp.]
MSLFGEILGGIADVGGAAISGLSNFAGIGQPILGNLGKAVSGLGSSLMGQEANLTSTGNAEAYNSPQNVMARYKAAGLNPNLIYTNGTTYTAPPTASTSFSAPDIQTYQDFQLKQGQYDNLKQAVQTGQAQEFMDYSHGGYFNQERENSSFDLSLKNQLRDTSVQAAQLGVQQQTQDIAKTSAETSNISESTKATLDSDLRAEFMKGVTMQQALVNVLQQQQSLVTNSIQQQKLNQEISNLQNDQQLSKMNFRPNDVGKTAVDAGLGILLHSMSLIF